MNLKGTEFDKTVEFVEKYKEDGIIWFLEACELNVFSIRRAVWQLDHAGWFKYTKGFLIGRPMLFDQPMMGLGSVSGGDGYSGEISGADYYGCGSGASASGHADYYGQSGASAGAR